MAQAKFPEFGAWMDRALTDADVSTDDLAAALGISSEAARLYRVGQSLPGSDRWKRIAELLGVPMEDVMDRTIEAKRKRATARKEAKQKVAPSAGGSANGRPSVTDMLDDPEAKPDHGLVRVAGHFVSKGYDESGLMYAVEVAFHVRPDARETYHAAGLTRPESAPARPAREVTEATSAGA